MDTRRHQIDQEALKRRFVEAIELPPQERAALLASLQAEDPSLHAALLPLLDAHDRAGEFFSEPTRAPAPPSGQPVAAEAAGDRVGPFTLVSRLGEGGFAVVWLARQEQPVRRDVAVKILKPGMDSRQILARFDAERQALALLTHPSIARVLDAGATAQGRPYFAMELVAGSPITVFCDAEQLTLRERLQLFMAVCHAVQHAHQKGIVHRDLKPTNVLVSRVDGRPLPVVIDFGIAKAIEEPLTAADALTEARQMVGTPQYMAPEQAAFESAGVDTRTDVYSLGILLYELLAGVSPYDVERLKRANLAEIGRIVREDPVRKPSTRLLSLGAAGAAIAAKRRSDEWRLRRELRGDLDWIVLRATQKDPDQRYPTAYALAGDIERHLRNEPVTAGPPSRAYLLRKFVRRHRAMVAAGTIALAAIIGGLVMALAGLREANAMRGVAEDALQTATDRLRETYLAQARASRAGSQSGRRAEALAAIRSAASIRPSLALRNEAIAALALEDVEFRDAAPRAGHLAARGLRSGDRIALADEPGVVRIVQSDDAAEISLAVGDRRPAHGAFSADGAFFACALFDSEGAGATTLWDASSGRELLSLKGAPGAAGELCVAAPPERPAWIALVVAAGSVRVHAVPDGAVLLDEPLAGPARIAQVGDDRLAIAEVESENVRVVSVSGRSPEQLIPTPARPVSVASDPAGSLLAVGLDDRRVAVVDLASGETARLLVGHQGLPVQVGFALGGRVVLSYAWDNTVRCWDAETGRPLLAPIAGWQPLALGDAFHAVSGDRVGLWRYSHSSVYDPLRIPEPFGVNSECAFLDGASFVATAGDNGVRLWNGDSGRELATLSDAPANGLAAGTAGTLFLATDEGILVASVDTDQPSRSRVHTLVPIRPPIDAWVTCTPKRDRLVTVTARGISVFTASSGELLRELPRYAGLAERPDVSADSRWLFTGNWRGAAGRLWDLASGEPVRDFAGDHVVGRFDPRGERLVVAFPDRFTCYSAPDWTPLWTVEREWSDSLAGVVAHDPSGRFVAIGYTRSELRLVDPATGAEFATLEAPRAHELNDAHVSPDGKTLVCTTVDSIAHRWRLDELRRLLRELHPDLDLFHPLD